jgi:hypothetical protein
MADNPWANYGGGIERGGGVKTKSPWEKAIANRSTHVKGKDRIVARTSSNKPTVRQAATDKAVKKTDTSSGRNAIKDMQRALNKRGANLVVDGIMGSKTRAAQNRYGSGNSTDSGNDNNSGGGDYYDDSGGTNFGGYPADAAGRAAASTQSNKDITALRADRLAAALEAIGTQFASQKGQFESQLGELANVFNRTQRLNERQGETNIDAIGNAAAERGIYKSGINAKATSEEFARQAEESADLIGALNTEEGAKGTEVRKLESAIGLLGQQQAQAESMAKLDAEKDELDIAQLVAMINGGLR